MTEHPIFEPVLSPWSIKQTPLNDVIVSSRICLSRNLANHIFPIYKQNKEIIEQVNQFLPDSYIAIKISQIPALQQMLLLEKLLISDYLIYQAEQSAVFINQEENISVMVNEEDHIHIQCLAPSLDLFSALEATFKVESLLEKGMKFAFDKEFGYLTSSITKLGTAMHAAVMVHLPGLVTTNRIRQIVEEIRSLGFVVKGTYSEKQKTMDNLFQISNQTTLGKTEEEIIEDLIQIMEQLIIQERSARVDIKQKYAIALEDQVYRAYGLLKNSRVISDEESAEAISILRLGISLGFLKHIPYSKINELLLFTKPGFLQQAAGKKISDREAKITRASSIRSILQDL